MSWKDDFILKHGEAAYDEHLVRCRVYHKAHPEQEKARNKRYYEEHPEEVRAKSHETNRKGGRHYDKQLKKDHTGLRGKRSSIRHKHGKQYRPYKNIIAPDSQLHHQWRPETAEYDGIALVEKGQHMHGFINPIQILEGEITLFTEEDIRNGGNRK